MNDVILKNIVRWPIADESTLYDVKIYSYLHLEGRHEDAARYYEICMGSYPYSDSDSEFVERIWTDVHNSIFEEDGDPSDFGFVIEEGEE